MPAGNPQGYAKPNGGKQNRTRRAGRLIPGLNVVIAGEDAANAARDEANRAPNPEVEAQRAAALRVARLQAMRARAEQMGDVEGVTELDEVIASLGQGPSPLGAAAGAAAGAAGRRRMSPAAAQRRNAFAGMGPR